MNDKMNNISIDNVSDEECYPIELERAMWNAALNKDSAAFSELVSEDAVMLCGGARLTGAQYAELISGFGISGFELSEFELLTITQTLYQVHYIVRTMADSPENADLAGVFRVTSTWQMTDDKWRLIFNMDQRIYL